MSAYASRVVKRSLVIAGHSTSISLEDEFWQALRHFAALRNMSIAGLVAEIDGMGRAANLSSALRVFCLREAMRGQGGLEDSAALASP